MLAGFCEGRCKGAPELLRRRSLLLSAESMGWEPSRAFWVVEDKEPVERDCEGGGKAGRRRGGLAVETCGLKVTFLVGLVGRGSEVAEVVGRSGVVSDMGAVEEEEAIVV